MRAIYLAVLVSVLASAVVSVPDKCEIGRSAPVYKQCDSQWGSNPLGSSSTICKVGCLMCSVASGMTSLGKTIDSQTVTPAVLNKFLLSNGGYYGNLFVWATVERFGLKYRGQFNSKDIIKQAICDKKITVLLVNNGSHWVLATGFEGDTFYVNDSGYSRGTYSAGEVILGAIYD